MRIRQELDSTESIFQVSKPKREAGESKGKGICRAVMIKSGRGVLPG